MPAMKDDLRNVIDELQAAIAKAESDDVIDAEERARLRALAGRLETLLSEPEAQQGEGDDHEGIVDQLDEAAVSFETNHPSLATVLRGIMDTLSNYGI